MNTEQEQRLDKALKNIEAGKYKKAKCTLELVDFSADGQVECRANCCLGALTREAMEMGLEITEVPSSSGRRVYFDETMSILPAKVRDFYGFDASNPHITVRVEEEERADGDEDEVYLSCSELNDSGAYGRDYDLPEVASIIRKNYLP